jgi:hypothetical protein
MPVSSVPLSETHVTGRPREAMMASSSRTTRSPGSVGHQRQAFPREVIDDRQNAEPSTVTESPGSSADWDLAAVSSALLCRALACARHVGTPAQPFFAVEPAELLVVHDDAFACEQEVQPAMPEPTANGGQLAKPRTYAPVVRAAAAITDRCAIGSERRTRPPLADLIRDPKVSDGLSPGGGRHNFFVAISFSMALSSIASAKSFFSLAFSSFNDCKRFASDTSSPPYLAFHL